MLMFGSFDTWRSHEMNHRREWFCPLCDLVHHDKSKAKMHLMHHHGKLAEKHELETLLQTSSRPSENLPADDCPFCDWGMTLREHNRTPKEHDLTVPSRRFMRHLGRHLEEIALFVVPQPEEEQRSADDFASDVAHSVLDEDSATASTLSSFRSQPSSGASVLARQSQEPPSDEAHPGLCPYPTCGRHVKDLKQHMVTHQNERPEKCPVPTCDYHTKGFARKYDKNRHLLTHYKGKLVCGFCPGSGSAAEKNFNRADIFKRHLTSVHGVQQIPPNVRRRHRSLSRNIVDEVAGTCSTCSVVFPDAQEFYEHLDHCVVRVVLQADSPEARPKLSDTRARHAEFSPRNPSYFSVGRVFDVLWTEKLAQDTWVGSVTKEAEFQSSSEQTQPGLRRFIIVRKRTHHFSALPISTSCHGEGVTKSGVTKFEHGRILTDPRMPSPSENEVLAESPTRLIPIRVDFDRTDWVLFGATHIFSHNVETKSAGVAQHDSVTGLVKRFDDVFGRPNTAEPDTGEADVASDIVEDEDESEDIAVSAVSDSARGNPPFFAHHRTHVSALTDTNNPDTPLVVTPSRARQPLLTWTEETSYRLSDDLDQFAEFTNSLAEFTNSCIPSLEPSNLLQPEEELLEDSEPRYYVYDETS